MNTTVAPAPLQPLHTHDCDFCVFLGSQNGDDLYFHPGDTPTVVARHSSRDNDYISGFPLVPHVPALASALGLAHWYGLLIVPSSVQPRP